MEGRDPHPTVTPANPVARSSRDAHPANRAPKPANPPILGWVGTFRMGANLVQ
jgi:hypothetical protein